MLELTITGRTVQELFDHAAGVLGLLVTGGQALAGQKEVMQHTASVLADAAQAEAAERLVTDTPAPRRGRPPKVKTPELPNDPVPDLAADAPGQAPNLYPTQPAYTLDGDIRPKIRELMKSREAKLKAELPVDQHKNIMTLVTDWMMAELFAPFSIKKASDLGEDKFGEFMAKAEALA